MHLITNKALWLPIVITIFSACQFTSGPITTIKKDAIVQEQSVLKTTSSVVERSTPTSQAIPSAKTDTTAYSEDSDCTRGEPEPVINIKDYPSGYSISKTKLDIRK